MPLERMRQWLQITGQVLLHSLFFLQPVLLHLSLPLILFILSSYLQLFPGVLSSCSAQAVEPQGPGCPSTPHSQRPARTKRQICWSYQFFMRNQKSELHGSLLNTDKLIFKPHHCANQPICGLNAAKRGQRVTLCWGRGSGAPRMKARL